MSAVRRLSWILLAASGMALVPLMVGGCGQGAAPVAPLGQSTLATNPTDGPTVTVGGYTFGSNSNRLSHPFFKATSTTPNWVYSGIGTCAGDVRTCLFSDGGLVAGVKTLRMSKRDIDDEDPAPGWWEDFWYAQDTQGNLHTLRHQVTRNNKGKKEPAQLWGVAAGDPPAFWLPRASQLTLNHIWTWSMSGKVVYQCKVISLTGEVGGKSGLLVVRGISDQNGDGVFDPGWNGPDKRDDNWYQPAAGPWYWQWHRNGGLLQQ